MLERKVMERSLLLSAFVLISTSESNNKISMEKLLTFLKEKLVFGK